MRSLPHTAFPLPAAAGISDLLAHMVQQMIVSKPSNPMQFVRDHMASDPPRLPERIQELMQREYTGMGARITSGQLLTAEEMARFKELSDKLNPQLTAEDSALALEARMQAGMLLSYDEMLEYKRLRGTPEQSHAAALEQKILHGHLLSETELAKLKEAKAAERAAPQSSETAALGSIEDALGLLEAMATKAQGGDGSAADALVGVRHQLAAFASLAALLAGEGGEETAEVIPEDKQARASDELAELKRRLANGHLLSIEELRRFQTLALSGAAEAGGSDVLAALEQRLTEDYLLSVAELVQFRELCGAREEGAAEETGGPPKEQIGRAPSWHATYDISPSVARASADGDALGPDEAEA